MSWTGYAALLGAFLLSHSLPLRPGVRDHLVAALGRRGFGLAYSALSLGMLGAVIHGADRAPHLLLWQTRAWHFPVVQGGMAMVFLLLGLTLGRPNPFSFGGRGGEGFDPGTAGLIGRVRHPVLVALMLWSALHLLPNGDLAHVVLFGLFLLFALSGQRRIDARRRRELGEARWRSLLASARASPLRPAGPDATGTALRIACSGLAYGAMILAHPVLFGVAPW